MNFPPNIPTPSGSRPARSKKRGLDQGKVGTPAPSSPSEVSALEAQAASLSAQRGAIRPIHGPKPPGGLGRGVNVTPSLLSPLLQSGIVRNKKPARISRSSETQLGNVVRICRAELGITQEELAWRANMHRSYIADIERGGRNITLRSITALAKALQIPVERLLANSRSGIELGEILMVEDNAADAELVQRSFRRAHVANPLRVARDGNEALDILFGTGRFAKSKPPLPQIILLDLKLPTLSGVEVLRQIKADARTRQIPVVVLTVSRQDAAIIECGRLGAENYILKPVNFENLSKLTPVLKLRWALIRPAETPAEPPR